jgi:hypothetical protein
VNGQEGTEGKKGADQEGKEGKKGADQEGKEGKKGTDQEEEEKDEDEEEDEEGDGGKMVDGVYITDGGETEIPSATENTTTVDRIKDGDTIIDFHKNKDNKENPKYMLMSTFEQLRTPKIDPWNRLPILRATTYKAKIKHSGNNTRKSRKNEKPSHSNKSS